MSKDPQPARGFFDGLSDPSWPKAVLALRHSFIIEKRNMRGCRKCAESALKRKYQDKLRRLGWVAI